MSDSIGLEPLLQAFPQWRTSARSEKSGASEYSVLEIEPPTKADAYRGLLVHTDNGEISVTFDHYHARFDDWYEFHNGQATDSALEFIRRLIGEEVVVLSWWQGDEWRGSTYTEKDAPVEVPSWANPATGVRIRVRSWNGTYNRETAA